jgi:hypothetical protein
MKYTTKEYSKLLDGGLPSSNLEFELCDRLLDFEYNVDSLLSKPLECPNCGTELALEFKEISNKDILDMIDPPGFED